MYDVPESPQPTPGWLGLLHIASVFALVAGAAAWLAFTADLRIGADPNPAAEAAHQARRLIRRLAAALLALIGLGRGWPRWLLAALGSAQAGLAAALVLL